VVATDGSGNWNQSGFQSGPTYRVTPSKSNYTFTPAYRDFSAAATNLNFTGSTIPVNTYSGALTTSDGRSVRRSNRYAEVWSFSLSNSATIQIDMTSFSFDNFLILYRGTQPSPSGYITENDDTNGRNARISTSLSPGIYCIEAASYSANVTGSYTLTSTVPLYTAVEVWDLVVVEGLLVNMSNDEWNNIKEHFSRASNMLFDATDGQVRLGTITMKRFSLLDLPSADVVLTRKILTINRCAITINLPWDLGHIDLSMHSEWCHNYGTIVHELGHYKFNQQTISNFIGLGDEYTIIDHGQNCNDNETLCRSCGPSPGRGRSLMELQYYEGCIDTTSGGNSCTRGTSEFCTTPDTDLPSAHMPLDRSSHPSTNHQNEINNGQSCWQTIHNYNNAIQMPGGDPLPGPCSKSDDADSALSHEPMEANECIGALVNIIGP
jgi:hypothetical protein